jgi:predicted nucleic acid-binding protein
MTGLVFVDSNVLVYSVDETEPDKQTRAAEWLKRLWSTRAGRLSFQVLQEFYVNVTRATGIAMPAADAREIARSLLAWQPVRIGAGELEAAWSLQDRYSISWWDALIVAAASSAGCRFLLTEDLQHDQDFGGLRVVDPFRVQPQSLLAE